MFDLSPEGVVARLQIHPQHFTAYGEGWIYGTWYCGTSFQKAIYYGQYPATFVKRITRAFPPSVFKMLHWCCGRAHIEGAINLDLHRLPEVDVRADVEASPFAAGVFDVIIIDPPYSEEDASRYNVRRLVSSRKAVAEADRLLRPDGWLCWLDEKYPMVSCKHMLRLRGLIGVVTGFERRTRILSMFHKELRRPDTEWPSSQLMQQQYPLAAFSPR